jgi:hypothetical protein
VTATARLHVTPAGRVYKLDGAEVPSVTTILNSLPKNLTQWAADSAANYAVENWAELTEKPMTKRLDSIRYAHRDTLSTAATRGTEIHGYGEKLVKGEVVEIPDEHRGPAQAYARFLDMWQIEPVATEAAIVNTTQRFAGRGDLWANVGKRDGAFAYIDLKTGKGIYESVILQCSGYDNGDLWQPDGPASEEPYAPVDLVFVAHILPDDVRMIPIRGSGGAVKPGPAEYRQFLYVQQTHLWLKRHGYKATEPLIEDAVRP